MSGIHIFANFHLILVPPEGLPFVTEAALLTNSQIKLAPFLFLAESESCAEEQRKSGKMSQCLKS